MTKKNGTRLIRVSERTWRILKAQAEQQNISLRVLTDFFFSRKRYTSTPMKEKP